MRKLLWVIIAALGMSTAAQAQPKWGEDSVKCRENLYIYYEQARAKNYVEAYDSWIYVFENCPACSKNNIIYGPYIVKAKIKGAADDVEKEEFKNLLMKVYDKRLELYPSDEAYVLERKGLDMIQQWPDSNQAAYSMFKRALELSNEHSASFYNAYFIAAARLFNAKVFDITDVFEAYNVVQEGLEYNNNVLNRRIKELKDKQEAGTIDDKEVKELKKAEVELGKFEVVTTNNGIVLGPIATCEKLKLIYNEETFEANKADPIWLSRAAKMLTRERTDKEGEVTDCTDDPIFFKVAVALYELEPSPTAARSVGYLALKNKNYSKAIEYFKEAATLEVDPKKQASDYYIISTTQLNLGRLAATKSAAQKAASLRGGWGAPYLIIAQAYARGEAQCGGKDVFEKKALYWAAIDKLKYAKSIDATVTSKANGLISNYKQQLPAKTVIFQIGIKEGDKFTIGCFINETITVEY